MVKSDILAYGSHFLRKNSLMALPWLCLYVYACCSNSL